MGMERGWYATGMLLIVNGLALAFLFAFVPFAPPVAWLRIFQYPSIFVAGATFGTLTRQIHLEKWFKQLQPRDRDNA